MPKKSRDIEGVQHRLEAGRPPTSPESHAGTSARARLMMNRKPKSLMKRSDLSTKGAVGAGGQPSAAAGSARPRTAGSAATRLERSTTGTTRPATKLATSRPVASKTPKTPPMPVPAGRQQQIEERIAAATEELASGITEAASAAEELRRTMEQIATGAEEAASAAQQTLAVANTTASTLLQARQRAESAQGRSESLRSLLAETASQVRTWASNIRSNGERQTGSVAVMDQLSAASREHRRRNQDRQPCFGRDQSAGAQCCHRGCASWRSRAWFCRRGRRGAGAGGDLREECARCAKSCGANSATGEVRRRDDQGGSRQRRRGGGKEPDCNSGLGRIAQRGR